MTQKSDIELLLTASDNLERNLQPWLQIENKLKETRQHVVESFTGEERIELETKISRKENTLRRERNRRIENTLHDISLKLNDPEVDFGQIDATLDALQGQIITEEQQESINRLRGETVLKRTAIAEQREYDQVKKQIDSLFAEAEAKRHEGATEQILVANYYQEALRIASNATGRFPNSLSLSQLKNQTEALYNRMRQQAELLTTAMQLGKFQELLDELQDLMQTDPDRQVDKFDENGISQGKAPVTEVYYFVEQRAAVVMLKKVREEYIPQAHQFLDNKNPRAAYERLESVLRTPFLSDESRAVIREVLDTRVKPDLEKLETAERLLAQSRLESNLHTAMKLIEQAQTEWQDVPSLEGDRASVIERMRRQGERLLADAQQALERREVIRARELLTQIEAFAGYDPALEGLGSQVNLWRIEADQVERESAEAPQVAQDILQFLEADNFPEADQRLQSFERKYKGATRRQPELLILKERIDARLNVQSLARHARELLRSGSLEAIQRTLDTCEEAIQKNNSEAIAHNLPAIRSHLEIHHLYLQGGQAWQRYDANEARQYLTQVVNSTIDQRTHIDLAEDIELVRADIESAKDLLSRIEIGVRQDNQIDAVLKRTVAALKGKPNQVNLVSLYHELASYTDVLTSHRQRFDQAFDDLSSAIEAIALQKIQDALDQTPPPLDVLEQQWEYLSDLLQSSHVRPLERRVRLEIARLRGQHAFEMSDWAEAATQYETATRLSAGDKTLNTSFREARRQHVKIIIRSGLGNPNPDFENLLAVAWKFEYDEPADAEARFLLAEVLAELARTEQSLEAVQNTLDNAYRAIQIGLQYVKGGEEHLQARLQSLSDQVSAEREAVYGMLQAEEKLRLNRRLKSFRDGVSVMTDTLVTLREFRGLSVWWSNTRKNLIHELRDKINKTGDYWGRFSYLTKLKVLDEDSEQTSELAAVNTHIHELLAHVNDAVNDYIGAGLTPDHANALDKQIIHVETVDRWLVDLRETHETGLVEVEEATLKRCDDARPRLSQKLEELRQVQRLVMVSKSYADSARRNDSRWQQFNETLQEIARRGYSNHQIMLHLRAYENKIKETGRDLEECISSVQQAFHDENYSQLQDALSRMKTLDPGDDYGLQIRLRVTDEFKNNATLSSSDVIAASGQKRKQQIQLLEEWLGEVIDPAFLRSFGQISMNRLATLVDRQQDVDTFEYEHHTHIVRSREVIQAADTEMRKSHFIEAKAILEASLQDQRQELPMSLHYAMEWLQEPPVRSREVESYRAAGFLRLGEQTLEMIKHERKAIQDSLEKVEQEQKSFTDNLKRFDEVLDSLAANRVKGARRQELIQQAHTLFKTLHDIAPDYTGLMENVTDYRLLRLKE